MPKYYVYVSERQTIRYTVEADSANDAEDTFYDDPIEEINMEDGEADVVLDTTILVPDAIGTPA